MKTQRLVIVTLAVALSLTTLASAFLLPVPVKAAPLKDGCNYVYHWDCLVNPGCFYPPVATYRAYGEECCYGGECHFRLISRQFWCCGC
jgi:hypothetical protein